MRLCVPAFVYDWSGDQCRYVCILCLSLCMRIMSKIHLSIVLFLFASVLLFVRMSCLWRLCLITCLCHVLALFSHFSCSCPCPYTSVLWSCHAHVGVATIVLTCNKSLLERIRMTEPVPNRSISDKAHITLRFNKSNSVSFRFQFSDGIHFHSMQVKLLHSLARMAPNDIHVIVSRIQSKCKKGTFFEMH